MTLKERNPASSTLLYQRAMDRRAASLIVFVGKDHPQGMAQSVCRFDVRVFFKQYRSPLLLPVGPFVGRLEQEITRAYKQFLAGVSIGIAVRDILLTVLSGFLHLIISLLHGIPTVFDAQLLYGITSQFLDMEAVDDPAGFRNAVRTILRMESDKSSVTSSTALRCSSSIRCRTAITSSAFVPATSATKDCSACGPHGWLHKRTAHHWIARIRR